MVDSKFYLTDEDKDKLGTCGTLICNACGAEGLSLTEDGEFFCSECGSSDIRECGCAV